jgi:pyrimidine-nucleoside phosphorylase
MNTPFSPVRAILRKRDGDAHPHGEIEELIRCFVAGDVADYQMAAWMMAVFFRGLTRSETARLTRSMLGSGECLAAWSPGSPVVDKHSTGGVGDKVSLIVAPIVAACGLRVPMISGRALGHTGGTLDKLESIPGFQTRLESRAFHRIVERVGCCIAGASEDIVPADRRMYALRDVAGIVESHPLIVSSILSKKAAARLDGLVLDVKVGVGGFAPSSRRARALAERLVQASTDLGIRTEALLTAMDDPLGRAVGNALEVEESIRLLRCEKTSIGLETVSIEIACAMLRVAGIREATARARVLDAWRSGRALDVLGQMIAAQGGDRDVTRDPGRLPRAPIVRTVRAERSGFLAGIDAREIGEIVIDMGGGRRAVDDAIDPRVGILLHAGPGDRVEKGTPIAELHISEARGERAIRSRLVSAFRFVERRPRRRPVVIDRIHGGRPRG